jgi:hypothetical protein
MTHGLFDAACGHVAVGLLLLLEVSRHAPSDDSRVTNLARRREYRMIEAITEFAQTCQKRIRGGFLNGLLCE